MMHRQEIEWEREEGERGRRTTKGAAGKSHFSIKSSGLIGLLTAPQLNWPFHCFSSHNLQSCKFNGHQQSLTMHGITTHTGKTMGLHHTQLYWKTHRVKASINQGFACSVVVWYATPRGGAGIEGAYIY